MASTKTCTKCKMVKPAQDFNKRSDQKDNLATQCRVCASTHLSAANVRRLKEKGYCVYVWLVQGKPIYVGSGTPKRLYSRLSEYVSSNPGLVKYLNNTTLEKRVLIQGLHKDNIEWLEDALREDLSIPYGCNKGRRKPVYGLCPDTGFFIYNKSQYLGKGFRQPNISKCLAGVRNKHATLEWFYYKGDFNGIS